jgi:murein DD-endopeptidase MepM/ murein hydrolase activator NlpD
MARVATKLLITVALLLGTSTHALAVTPDFFDISLLGPPVDFSVGLEEELASLELDDKYFVDHLLIIDAQIDEQTERFTALESDARRVFSQFTNLADQATISREYSQLVLGKAVDQVVTNYVNSLSSSSQGDAALQGSSGIDREALLLLATKSNSEIFPQDPTLEMKFGWGDLPVIGLGTAKSSADSSALVDILAELERTQKNQADERSRLRADMSALSEHLEEIDNFEEGLIHTIRALRAELAALQARKVFYSEDQISPYSMILPSSSPITSGYGWRWHPILRQSRRHEGVDFDATYNDPVWAAHSGVVETASYSKGFGRYIVINHGDGFTTLYAHLNSRNVRSGEKVQQGQTIGEVGSSGLSTGPHLHFEVRVNNVIRDPKNYLPY